MRHVNYARWAAYVIGLFGHAGGKVRSVLDVSCGTGSVLIELAYAGFDVWGFDYSPHMVQQAKRKFQARGLAVAGGSPLHRRAGGSSKLWCGDMRSFGVRASFDVALCLYDSMNYCLELESIGAALRSIANVVRPGGLLIFDVCTEHNCRTHFADHYERDATEHYSYTRHSYFQPRRLMQVNEFMIVDEREPTRRREVHEQKIYRLDALRALCDLDRWRLVGCYEGFTRRTGDENSDRVHFLLKRL
jgi:SAM-dependent methyltransferase